MGGGAAGFFCAANLDAERYHVIILEQNSDVLQKVKISGGGRCNVSHACFEPRELVSFYPRGNKELLSVFHKFQPGDTMTWFEEREIPLKVENDNRVFPESNSSQSIINALTEEVRRRQFNVYTQAVVVAIERGDFGFIVKTNNQNFSAEYVIYTPGSSPKAVRMVENLGHQIVPAVPSLFTFNIKSETITDLMGTSFENACVTIPQLKTEESGPLLITHWGLSGPAILKISAWKARELAQLRYHFEIIINFVGISRTEADELFRDYRLSNPKKNIGSAKIFNVTARFWHRILFIAGVSVEKNISNVSSQELDQILIHLCESRMQVTGKSTYKDEFVTAGGVELKEIDFKTMQSKLIPNFFLAGEVLNIDAVTGGFNFQACWSEGWIIAEYLNSKEY